MSLSRQQFNGWRQRGYDAGRYGSHAADEHTALAIGGAEAGRAFREGYRAGQRERERAESEKMAAR